MVNPLATAVKTVRSFAISGLQSLSDDWVGEGAKAFDSDGDGFAGLEPALGSAAEADAGRRAGGDDVAGEQRRDGGEIFDERRES